VTGSTLPPDLEKRMRLSVARGRLQISDVVQGDDPMTRATRITRGLAAVALGLLVAGFAILAVFVIVNLVFHIVPG